MVKVTDDFIRERDRLLLLFFSFDYQGKGIDFLCFSNVGDDGFFIVFRREKQFFFLFFFFYL